MTDPTAPTITANELADLTDTLNRVADVIRTAPEWCEATPLGLLSEADEDAINAAVKVVRRLRLDVRYPRGRPAAYLPVADPQPQPQPQPTVPSITDVELYAEWRGDRITDAAYRAECENRGWQQSFGGRYVMPKHSVKS